MRESWTTKRFWFNYGMKKSFDIDAVYWSALHDDDEDFGTDEGLRAKLSEVEALKMHELAAYRKEWAAHSTEMEQGDRR
jgi:hypothetical protein